MGRGRLQKKFLASDSRENRHENRCSTFALLSIESRFQPIKTVLNLLKHLNDQDMSLLGVDANGTGIAVN